MPRSSERERCRPRWLVVVRVQCCTDRCTLASTLAERREVTRKKTLEVLRGFISFTALAGGESTLGLDLVAVLP